MARFTTLFDLYGLPHGFPDLDLHADCADTAQRAMLLERAMKTDLQDERLIPYLQRHEFEALVLGALDGLASVLDDPQDMRGLQALKVKIGSTCPEDINDGAQTSPSHRLTTFIPGYQKPIHGPMAIERMGLDALRAVCPRFNAWIATLEVLSA